MRKHFFNVKTEFSFRKCYGKVSEVVERLEELGAESAAICDFCSTWGHRRFYEECEKRGIKPILGIEIPLEDENPETWTSVFLLPKNNSGLQKLYKTVSLAHHNKRDGLPCLKREQISADFMEDVFVFFPGVLDSFLKNAGALSCFDSNYKIKRKPFSALNFTSNLFPRPEDKLKYEFFTGNYAPAWNGWISDDSEEGMLDSEISDSIEFIDLPKAPLFQTSFNLLQACTDGRTKREEEGKILWDSEYEKRLMREIEVIQKKNFDFYFEIVSKLTHWAKERMLVGPGRGSAAGSLVCFLLGITEIDPLKNGLLFERFLDETRSDFPDIDLDFPDYRREEIIQYISKTFGGCAKIGNVTTLQQRGLINNIIKKYPLSDYENEYLEKSKFDFETFEQVLNFELCPESIRTNPDFSEFQNLIDHADHSGVHASGVLIYPDDAFKYSVIDSEGVAHLDKDDCEALGLLKIDVLGLRTLSILEDAKTSLNWYSLPLDDEKTFKLFQKQNVTGVFQFDGQAARNLLKKAPPKNIHELDHLTALARPGPLRSGAAQLYIDRKKSGCFSGSGISAEDAITSETFGVPIYQEQTMRFCSELAGFSVSDTNKVRRVVAKSKGKEALEEFKEKFLKGCIQNGFSEEFASEKWQEISEAGGYQMNKAHTFSYSVISYWTAYLKANFPVQFYHSKLLHSQDDEETQKIITDAVENGVEVVPFDPEKSGATWTTDGVKIYGGFSSVKGIGEKKAAKLLEERAKGNFRNINKIDEENFLFNLSSFFKENQDYYSDPMKKNILEACVKISELKNKDFEFPTSFNVLGTVSEIIEYERENYRGKKEFVIDFVLTDSESLKIRIRDKTYSLLRDIFRENVREGSKILCNIKMVKDYQIGFLNKFRVEK